VAEQISSNEVRTNPSSAGAKSEEDSGDSLSTAFESAERIEATAEFFSSGFGAVSGKLGKEKQARLDRSLDALEAMGEGYKREEAIAHQQFHEVAAEVETAGRLFWEGLTDPDGLWNRMKAKGA